MVDFMEERSWGWDRMSDYVGSLVKAGYDLSDSVKEGTIGVIIGINKYWPDMQPRRDLLYLVFFSSGDTLALANIHSSFRIIK